MSNVKDLTVAEWFTLPSHGVVYPQEIGVKERFQMRSMTTNEEMLRLAPSDHRYENMSKIIDQCMVEGPGISAYDMCIGDYQYCLYMLRLVTYGSEYKISPVCPMCGNVCDVTLDINQLPLKEVNQEEMRNLLEFQLPSSKEVVKIMPSTPRLLDTILDKINLYKRKFESTLDSSVLCELAGIIYSVNNNRFNEVQLEEWAKKLNMVDANKILNYSKKLNEEIGIENLLTFDCPVCLSEFQAQLSITNEFFRPSSEFDW